MTKEILFKDILSVLKDDKLIDLTEDEFEEIQFLDTPSDELIKVLKILLNSIDNRESQPHTYTKIKNQLKI